ncbi:16036_t:CDS:2, partial [Racocetra persica]
MLYCGASCETATLTADLWTLRNNQDYIGVTCHWITYNWSLQSILLCCEKISYPYTAESILQFLISKYTEFNLENKIICVFTNNGFNIPLSDSHQQERLEKVQIRVIERNTLSFFSPVHAKAYVKVYLDNKE